MTLATTLRQSAVIVVAAAGLMTSGVLLERRVLRAGNTSDTAEQLRRGEVNVEGWEALISSGQRMGPSGARVTILEFGDFECPACREFETGPLRGVRAEFPTQVAVVFRHWPLPYHKSARPAAIASVCAANQGRFWEMHDRLFDLQETLASVGMWSVARGAGVRDSALFAECLEGDAAARELARDDSLAKLIGIGGTPSIIVNGKWLQFVPDSAEFLTYIRGLVSIGS